MLYTCDLITIGPVLGIHSWFIIGDDDEGIVWSEKRTLLGSVVCDYTQKNEEGVFQLLSQLRVNKMR